jgi:cell division protein FtsW
MRLWPWSRSGRSQPEQASTPTRAPAPAKAAAAAKDPAAARAVASQPSRWRRVGRALLGRGLESSPRQLDVVLAVAVIGLVGFGVVMVYSASSFEATVRFHDAQYFLKRQSIYAVLALLVMWLVSRIDYHRLRPLTYPLLVLVVALLVATVAGLGHRAGNAYRWLTVGRSTSSRPRWPRSCWCCGSATRCRRKARGYASSGWASFRICWWSRCSWRCA